MAAHDFQIMRARITCERIIGGEITVADVELLGHEPDMPQQLDGSHPVLTDDIEYFVEVIGGVNCNR